MKKELKSVLVIIALSVSCTESKAQGIQLGEVIMISTSAMKEVKPDAFEAYLREAIPTWSKTRPGVNMNLFLADRGKRKGQYLLVCGASKPKDRATLAAGSPFATLSSEGAASGQLSDFLSDPKAYTDYRLIGAEKFKGLPVMGILGIHYIRVKKELSADFEKFVVEKLHPSVGHVLPDMGLLYYKAVAGDNVGSYITVFALESVAARDKYWPAGSETQTLKDAFQPLKSLAQDLAPYLVDGSYLEVASGGGAAIFESLDWTDFVHHPVSK